MTLTFSRSPQSPAAPPVTSCRAALFQVASHWFALPATTILKVIPAPTPEPGTTSPLTVWDNRPLMRLDLYPLFARTRVEPSGATGDRPSASRRYMMIVWSQTGEYCGILVDEIPVLQELVLSQAQVIPIPYRQAIRNVAKYLVIHPYQGTALTILLLDLQQALHRIASFSMEAGLADSPGYSIGRSPGNPSPG